MATTATKDPRDLTSEEREQQNQAILKATLLALLASNDPEVVAELRRVGGEPVAATLEEKADPTRVGFDDLRPDALSSRGYQRAMAAAVYKRG